MIYKFLDENEKYNRYFIFRVERLKIGGSFYQMLYILVDGDSDFDTHYD